MIECCNSNGSLKLLHYSTFFFRFYHTNTDAYRSRSCKKKFRVEFILLSIQLMFISRVRQQPQVTDWTTSSAYFNNNLIWIEMCKFVPHTHTNVPSSFLNVSVLCDRWPFISSEFLVSVCYYYLLFVIIKRAASKRMKKKEKGINVGYCKWCKWRVIDCVCFCMWHDSIWWFIKLIHGDLFVIIANFSTYARFFIYLKRKKH